MRSDDVPESDWKVFRRLRERALERFCERTLARVQELCADDAGSAHERYLEVVEYLQKRDEDLAEAFDGPKRSQMILQLSAIHGHDLLEPEEFAEFTEETRERIETIRRTFSE